MSAGSLQSQPVRDDLDIMTERLPELWERRLDTGEVVDVSFPKRTIELVVIPYDVPAQVPHPTQPASMPPVYEVISRGAFDGIERRPNRVKANREHQELFTFGRARALYPSRENGLVADIQVADTDLGRETLQLAADGCLDASAGFTVKRGDWHWETRGQQYRVDTAWLRHISLVSEGAYGEAAGVLAVRAQPALAPVEGIRTPTPNADRLRAALERERYAAIDARYLGPSARAR